MTLACARQWQTTGEALSSLHECELAANHKGACYCKCGHNLASCARLPSSGTGPGEVPTRKPSEILADMGRLGVTCGCGRGPVHSTADDRFHREHT